MELQRLIEIKETGEWRRGTDAQIRARFSRDQYRMLGTYYGPPNPEIKPLDPQAETATEPAEVRPFPDED